MITTFDLKCKVSKLINQLKAHPQNKDRGSTMTYSIALGHALDLQRWAKKCESRKQLASFILQRRKALKEMATAPGAPLSRDLEELFIQCNQITKPA